MCARLKIDGRIYRPNEKVPTTAGGETAPLPKLWDGFARRESRQMWDRKGAKPSVIHADGFAERNTETKALIWDESPAEIEALVLGDTVRVVTREATAQEAARFGHPRMPKTLEI